MYKVKERFYEGLERIFERAKIYVIALFYPAALSIIIPNTFLNLVKFIANIVAGILHECGHFIFYIMGFILGILGSNIPRAEWFQFLSVLGGSLGYTLVPLLLFIYYAIKKKDGITASAYLGFLAISVDHMAWYCGDAVNWRGPIFGTENTIALVHDWHYMLTYLNLMDKASKISNFFYTIGHIIALVAIISGTIELIAMITKKESHYNLSLFIALVLALIIISFI